MSLDVACCWIRDAAVDWRRKPVMNRFCTRHGLARGEFSPPLHRKRRNAFISRFGDSVKQSSQPRSVQACGMKVCWLV